MVNGGTYAVHGLTNAEEDHYNRWVHTKVSPITTDEANSMTVSSIPVLLMLLHLPRDSHPLTRL